MPETWSGWREAMLAIKRTAGPGKYAIFLPMNEWPPMAILGLQAGSSLVTERGFGAFREPAFSRAFDFLLSIYRDGLAPPVSSNEIANLYQEFARGTFAMYSPAPGTWASFAAGCPPGCRAPGAPHHSRGPPDQPLASRWPGAPAW